MSENECDLKEKLEMLLSENGDLKNQLLENEKSSKKDDVEKNQLQSKILVFDMIFLIVA